MINSDINQQIELNRQYQQTAAFGTTYNNNLSTQGPANPYNSFYGPMVIEGGNFSPIYRDPRDPRSYKDSRGVYGDLCPQCKKGVIPYNTGCGRFLIIGFIIPCLLCCLCYVKDRECPNCQHMSSLCDITKSNNFQQQLS